MYMDMYIDMDIDMYINMSIGIFTKVSIDMSIDMHLYILHAHAPRRFGRMSNCSKGNMKAKYAIMYAPCFSPAHRVAAP